MSPKAHPFNTTRTHAPLTRLIGRINKRGNPDFSMVPSPNRVLTPFKSASTIMISSCVNHSKIFVWEGYLDRHIIRLSSSCDFNKTHHHAITMRRRLTHARSFNTARTHAQTTRRMQCFSMENSPCYNHHIVMLSSSCDFDRHVVMLSSSCEFDRYIVMLSSSCEFYMHIGMLSQSILFYQSNSTSESQDDDSMMCMSKQDDGSMMIDVSVELNFDSEDDDSMMCMSNSQDDGSMMMDVSVELNFTPPKRRFWKVEQTFQNAFSKHFSRERVLYLC